MVLAVGPVLAAAVLICCDSCRHAATAVGPVKIAVGPVVITIGPVVVAVESVVTVVGHVVIVV